MEDLDGAFLSDLVHTFDKLLALHGILLAYQSEMLGRKGRDTLKLELLPRGDDGVADGEHTGIEYADDVARIGFFDDLALLSPDLLGLRELHLSVALHMINFHILIESA